MANDPHRDLLPVKDTSERMSKGINERVDHHLLSKLKRSELEDRYFRLFDENTNIKKQLNIQEEKIKRLGTKLLRLINERKNGSQPATRKQLDESRTIDELQMRIVELEHENYTLKDKNVVLKQQLANHSRQHVAAHRSPIRSLHTSPRISQRQSSAPNINESTYTLSNRNHATDPQLREAEAHISGLNDEIKALHSKIDALQQDLEKSCLDNQRSKVTENIELIRLQRSLKQQAIQMASLQAQIKNSENSQKFLRDDLAKAHRENEEAMQIVAEKQHEVLELYTKLEEKSMGRLEHEEMKERINDLTSERDCLKERSEFLMQTISSKTDEAETVNELKRQLAAEKSKQEELKGSLERTEKQLQALKSTPVQDTSGNRIKQSTSLTQHLSAVTNACSEMSTQTSPGRSNSVPAVLKATPQNELDLLISTQLNRRATIRSPRFETLQNVEGKAIIKAISNLPIVEKNSDSHDKKKNSPPPVEDTEKSNTMEVNQKNQPLCRSLATSHSSRSEDSASFAGGLPNCGGPSVREEDASELTRDSTSSMSEREKVFRADRLRMERELEYMRQMLRSQTHRCENQQLEINRLSYELRLNEEKYNDTLRRLDLHLKIFQHLEFRMLQDDKTPVTEEQRESFLTIASAINNAAESKNGVASPGVDNKNTIEPVEPEIRIATESDENLASPKEKTVVTNEVLVNDPVPVSGKKDSEKNGEHEQTKRFVDQVFLESSDEDEDDVSFDKEPLFMDESEPRKKSSSESDRSKGTPTTKIRGAGTSSPLKVAAKNGGYSAGSLFSSFPSDSSLGFPQDKNKKDSTPKKPLPKPRGNFESTKSNSGAVIESRNVHVESNSRNMIKVTIQWLQLNTASWVWTDDDIRLLFVDFSLLDLKGEETETPDSLIKPKKPEEKCHYNFSKDIEMTESRTKMLESLLNKPDYELIVFKVVSDPEDFPEDVDCVDVGVAVLTVRQFKECCGNDAVLLTLTGVENEKENIGVLAVKIDASSDIMNRCRR